MILQLQQQKQQHQQQKVLKIICFSQLGLFRVVTLKILVSLKPSLLNLILLRSLFNSKIIKKKNNHFHSVFLRNFNFEKRNN